MSRRHFFDGMQGRVTDVHFGLATLDDVVGVIEGAKHRHAYHGALLLKKASAWHGAWESAHLQHDPITDLLPSVRAHRAVGGSQPVKCHLGSSSEWNQQL